MAYANRIKFIIVAISIVSIIALLAKDFSGGAGFADLFIIVSMGILLGLQLRNPSREDVSS